jgi:4-amino-4-deoxy-L-arabinose transferase-like glycosyltransferase
LTAERLNIERLNLFLKQNTEKIFLAGLLAVSSFLLLYNLGGRLLWQDEAQTALIAKTVLAHGIPLVTDGINSFSQEYGVEAGADNIFKWHPWMEFYLTALSLKIFGINTFAAKLPFALMGIMIIMLVYFFAREISGSRRAAVLAAVMLVFSAQFLIMAKQARYYSPVMLFSILGLYEYTLIVSGKRKNILPLILYLTALFYTQNIYFGCLAAALLSHAAIYRKGYFLRILLAVMSSFILCVPWLIFSGMAGFKKTYPSMMTPGQFISYLPQYIGMANNYIFPMPMLVIPLIIRLVSRKKYAAPQYNGNMALLAVFALVNILAVSFFSVGVFYRYLAALLPVAPVAAGVIFDEAMNVKYVKWPAYALLIIMISPVWNYIHEITHEYRGPIEGIVKFLNENASKNDAVVITYEDMPVKFYTNLKVIGGATGEDTSGAGNAKWVILRGHSYGDRYDVFKQYMKEYIRHGSYKKITLDYPDSMFENRETPAYHLYSTPVNENPVIIYEKMK